MGRGAALIIRGWGGSGGEGGSAIGAFRDRLGLFTNRLGLFTIPVGAFRDSSIVLMLF